MKTLQTRLIQGFTGFSIVQFIGYLGISYKMLEQPMIVFLLMMVLYCLVVGVGKWATEQYKHNAILPYEKVFACFSETIISLVLLLFSIFVGIWIGS